MEMFIVEKRYQEKANVEMDNYEREIIHIASSIENAEKWMKQNISEIQGYWPAWFSVYSHLLDGEKIVPMNEFYYNNELTLVSEQPKYDIE